MTIAKLSNRIIKNLSDVSERRKKLLSVASELKPKIKELEKASTKGERMVQEMELFCGKEWEFLIDEADMAVMEINSKLDRAEISLENVESALIDMDMNIQNADLYVRDALRD